MTVDEILATIPQAWNARDWEAIGSLVADDHRFVDHRPASAGDFRGRDALLTYLSTLTDVATDARYRFGEIHRAGPRGGVAHWRIEGTNAEGGAFELEGLLAIEVRDGRIVRSDQFALDHLDDALSHYDILARS